MLAKLARISSIKAQSYLLFQIFAWVTLASLFVGIATDMLYLAAFPLVLLLGYLTIVDFEKVFYLLLFCIPLSTHIHLPGGLAIDLPSEPLMMGLMLVYGIYSLSKFETRDKAFLNHPITLLLLLHFAWILVSTITSSSVMVSFKFFLAKSWYIVVFYFLAHRYLKTEKDIRRFFWLLFIPLTLSVASIVIRHAAFGFSFKDVFRVLKPFYSNHVIYASTMVLLLPYVWFARKWYQKASFKWWYIIAGFLLFFVAIQLSYRRAPILCVYGLVVVYYVIRFRLMRVVLLAGSILAIFLASHMISNNTFMEYAPNFEKTISHQNFENLVEATAKGEDISSMERIHRWVAAGYMVSDKPLMGFGPGNFYFFYRPYTVSSFQTYVSDNPEKSGIHNYYMMILVEQGIFGFLIFMALTFFLLLKGEQIYHQTTDTFRKQVVMAALLSLVVLHILLLINDMIETDKIGTIYFMNMAILVNMDLNNRQTFPLKGKEA